MIKSLILFTLLSSCAQVTSLNLKRHQFGGVPTKIIWLQVAGLGIEHLALLKYDKEAKHTSSFENALCIGNTWDYNLLDLRPTAEEAFLVELTSRENIKGDCSDYDNQPIWNLLAQKNYKTAILESPSSAKQSLLYSKTCKNDNFLKETSLFKMERNKAAVGPNLFHFSERMQQNKDTIFFDRSCIEGDCEESFLKNSIAISEKFISNNKNSFLLLRDFTYLRAIEARDFKKAKLILERMDLLVNYLQALSQKDASVLFLVTSAQARNIDFPKAGKEWKDFISSNKNALNRNAQMISPVFVSGARGENFCSIYKKSDVLERMFTGAKKQGLELIILNPFSN